MGNLGDYKTVGKRVCEARLAFGPGYRIYFGIDRGSIIVLLMGGSKGSQKRDIRKAQDFWADYLGGI
jgi:putative addiction module killer protein